MENFLIRLKGFNPSNLVNISLKQKLQKLLEEAPSHSHINFTVSQQKDAMKGILIVHSTVGHFVAIASGKMPLEVADKLVNKIHRELTEWKQNRFHSKKFF